MKKTDSKKNLSKAMKKVQGKKRYEHTLGVAYTASALAMRYGASLEEAYTAGLLHDCAKCFTDEKMLSVCEKHHIPMTEVERRNPFLLHAKVGACYAVKKYGVESQDIVNAIRYHTTGRAAMSLLEKIIFVADYIEPGRKHAPNLPEIRRLAFVELDRAVLRILEDTVNYLKDGSGEIDPATEITLAYYREAVSADGKKEA